MMWRRADIAFGGVLKILLFVGIFILPLNHAYADDDDRVPLCDYFYTETTTIGDNDEVKSLREPFRQAQTKFKAVCQKLKNITVNGQKLDLEQHKRDNWTGFFGAKEEYDVYKQQHEREIAKLPSDLQQEFKEAQKAYKDAYSALYTAKQISNKAMDEKLPSTISSMGNAIASSPTFGGNPFLASSADQYANGFKEAYLNQEDLDRLEEEGLYEKSKKKLDNSSCKVKEMAEKYQRSCYACIVVKTLLEKFLNATTKVYDLCRDAGVQVLLIGSMIWIAFFVLKQISSLTNIEPASMVNTLLIQAFKIMFAYVVIVSGADTFIMYVVNPLLTAGADFGIGILDSAQKTLSTTPSDQYTYSGVSMISADMLNKILGFTEGVDRVVSTNLVIGHALTCHATHAGAWINETIIGVRIFVPNIWIFICGLLIWFAGFMMTLAVCYYLLDISFKLGLAIMIFPVVMGLWPFSLTSGKLGLCIATILRSAAIFAFLAITTSYALSLISVSLRDISELYARIDIGDSKWISDTFDITGPYFIIILFCYLYSIKLIGVTISDYVDRFFSGGLAAKAEPMHHELTRMTDMAKGAALGAAAFGKDVVAHQGGRALGFAAGLTIGRAAKFVKKHTSSNDGENNNAATRSGQATQTAGKATQTAGQATQTAGRTTAGTGRAVSATGRGVSAGGRGMMQFGRGLMAAGPLGMIAGAVVMAAGAAVSVAGKAVEYSGKGMQMAGKAMQKSGKAMVKAGKGIERAGKRVEDLGRRIDRGKPKKKENNDDNEDEENPVQAGNNASNQNDSGENEEQRDQRQ